MFLSPLSLYYPPTSWWYKDDDIPPFEYPTLHKDAPSIRMLKLLPPDSSQSHRIKGWSGVRCELRVAFLGDDIPPYEAVSYYWGLGPQRERTRVILVDDKRFNVSPIVEDMLLRLRDPKKARSLWIDLICIDQNNIPERNSQVGRIRDIFSQAQGVVASLGPHYTDSKRGLHSFTNTVWDESNPAYAWCPPLPSMPYVPPPPPPAKDRGKGVIDLILSATRGPGWFRSRPRLSSKDEDLILRFLEHHWFERIWVVQEVAMARTLTVISSTESFNAEVLVKLPAVLESQDGQLARRLSELKHFLDLLPSESRNGEKADLLTLLYRFRAWDASDPRDKVYALLGICTDNLNAPELQPDYQLPVAQVFERVARYTISTYNSLSILTHCAFPKEPAGEPTSAAVTADRRDLMANSVEQHVGYGFRLPSWCPDWSVRCNYPVQPEPSDCSLRQQPQEVPSRLYGLRSCPETSGILEVYGYNIVTITSFDNHGGVEMVASDTLACSKLPYNAISNHLTKLTASWPTARRLRIHDRLCILTGSTGLAILRPYMQRYRLVVLEHSQFPRLDLDGWRPPIELYSQQKPMFRKILLELVKVDRFRFILE
jgi:Heterokaryon incompatibility protein (HET)